MSKSECEALSFYQKCFSDYYLYKQPYEWDVNKKLIVKVTRTWEKLIHGLHCPTMMALLSFLSITYVLQHKYRFPKDSDTANFLAEIILYAVIGVFPAYALLYEGLFHKYDPYIFPGINRLLIFNRRISLYKYSLNYYFNPIYIFLLQIPENRLSPAYKREKYYKARYGSFLKLTVYFLILLPGSGIPVSAIYLKADPALHIIKHAFEALPVLHNAFKSTFGVFLPLGIISFRYFILLPVLYEICRTIILVLFIVILSGGQFLDAFHFQLELLKSSTSNRKQVNLQHILQYKQILIIRETFTPCLGLCLLGSFTAVAVSIIGINYCLIKMFDSLPIAVYVMLLYTVSVELLALSEAMKQASAINEASVSLLKEFRLGTSLSQAGRRKYILKVVKSLPKLSFPFGVPGFDFFSFTDATKRDIVQFLLEYTINVLLTF
jgi:hypothetical protein